MQVDNLRYENTVFDSASREENLSMDRTVNSGSLNEIVSYENSPKKIDKDKDSYLPMDSSDGDDSPSSENGSEFSPTGCNSKNENSPLRRSTQEKCQYDPCNMPSGTLEMRRLDE